MVLARIAVSWIVTGLLDRWIKVLMMLSMGMHHGGIDVGKDSSTRDALQTGEDCTRRFRGEASPAKRNKKRTQGNIDIAYRRSPSKYVRRN